MLLTGLRWIVVFVALVPLVQGDLAGSRPTLRRALPYFVAMGAFGYTIFNALFYVAAHYTGAANLTLLQGSMPVFVLAGNRLLYGAPIGPVRLVGLLLTLVGIAVVASHGSPAALLALDLNRGDAYTLAGCFLYSVYAVGLRHRPALPGTLVFAGFAAGAFVTALPLVAGEAWMGALQGPTLRGWLVVVFVALVPSLLSQLCFLRGVALIGAGRAGLFMNLVPVFGAFVAVALGETLHAYHAVALALVAGGIGVAELAGRR